MPSKGALDMTREEIAGASKADGGMFAVIPSVVMRDSTLSMSARMLYGIITWRCNSDSRCWPTNRALGEDLGLSPKRISSLLSLLEAQGHIEVEIVYDQETGQIIRRYIYPIVKSGRGIPKNKDTSPRECGEGIPENEEEKYKEEIININTPHSPPEGDKPQRKKRQRRPKSVPTWKPERFEAFWDYYPRGEDRMGAVEEWDKLRPDDALIDRMARALARQKASEEWQRGIGIPYACRWLRKRRWEDVPAQPQAQTPPPQRVVERDGVPVW